MLRLNGFVHRVLSTYIGYFTAWVLEQARILYYKKRMIPVQHQQMKNVYSYEYIVELFRCGHTIQTQRDCHSGDALLYVLHTKQKTAASSVDYQ